MKKLHVTIVRQYCLLNFAIALLLVLLLSPSQLYAEFPCQTLDAVDYSRYTTCYDYAQDVIVNAGYDLDMTRYNIDYKQAYYLLGKNYEFSGTPPDGDDFVWYDSRPQPSSAECFDVWQKHFDSMLLLYFEAKEKCLYDKAIYNGYEYNGLKYPCNDYYYDYVIGCLESFPKKNKSYPSLDDDNIIYWHAYNLRHTIDMVDTSGYAHKMGALEFRDIFAKQYINYINKLKVGYWLRGEKWRELNGLKIRSLEDDKN